MRSSFILHYLVTRGERRCGGGCGEGCAWNLPARRGYIINFSLQGMVVPEHHTHTHTQSQVTISYLMCSKMQCI